MDCSVRFVCEGRINSKGFYEQESGLKPALCVRGDKYALAVINDTLAVRSIEIDLVTHDKASFVTYHGEPYESKPFADRLLMSAKLAGKPITRRAKHILTLLDKTVETDLPQEILEVEPLEQERVYAENTPKERIKAAQRPSRVKDVTKEYAGQLREVPQTDYEKMADMILTGQAPKQTVVSVSTGIKKVPKKVARIEPPPTSKKLPTAAKAALAKGKPTADRGTLIKSLASEFKMTPFELRIMIRATGMRAPYDDERKVREAIAKGRKLITNAPKKVKK